MSLTDLNRLNKLIRKAGDVTGVQPDVSDGETDSSETAVHYGKHHQSPPISSWSNTEAYGPRDLQHTPQRLSATEHLSFLSQLNCTILPCKTTVCQILLHSFIQYFTVLIVLFIHFQTVKFVLCSMSRGLIILSIFALCL